MNHDDLVRHLSYYSDLMLRDLGRDYGRRYLRRCIPVWREHYGKDVADHMGRLIRQKLDGQAGGRVGAGRAA